jgi:hypothetical protein
VYLLVLRPYDIPLILAFLFVLLDDIARVGATIYDVLALFLAAHLDVAAEWLGHSDDVGVGLVPGDGVSEPFGTFAALDGEGPEEGAEECNELGLGEVDAGAGATAIAKGRVATKVGKFGQGLFVSRVGWVEEAFGLELGGLGVDRLVTRYQAVNLLVDDTVPPCSGNLLVVGVYNGVFGNEVTVVDIVLERNVRDTKRIGLAPTQNLFDGCA